MKIITGKGIYNSAKSGKDYPVTIISKETNKVLFVGLVYGNKKTVKKSMEKRVKELMKTQVANV